ncbi:maleylpyruvate isomerase N-terminal domain-containing protein [Yinghuangia soli]|uniref:Maleylpyruvate isomerase N-terminal domain-containing protein n=1 Tax=Yinghuangia soli TaxID=2908204 RepID=A0AA41PY39_9ACTN|nr:maleylpyruvate isomerase N-terminal domain-containing protein [Yinghuangia soli]MCF2527525.1 maleylpyruvate isomerase N-terminal domain-containing protein [Yinghuangia soli]
MADTLAPAGTPHSAPRTPVIAADIEATIAIAVAALSAVPADADWGVPAGATDWTCREFADHLVDALFSYAAQLAPGRPPTDAWVPFQEVRGRAGGPSVIVAADPEAGAAGVAQAVEAVAGMVAALVALRGPEVRSYHSYGIADPEGFAAMTVIETLVHTYDIGQGLGFAITPPEDLCDRALARLFPEAPAGTGRWQTMLWATGRAELPGQERRGPTWRWHSAPLGEAV